MKRKSVSDFVSGGGLLGSRKHGKSGSTSKSPALRLERKMEAEKNERKGKKGLMFDNIKDALKDLHRRK